MTVKLYSALDPSGKKHLIESSLVQTHIVFVKALDETPWNYFCATEGRDQAVIAVGQLLFSGNYRGFYIANAKKER